jgi:hypothetical protein
MHRYSTGTDEVSASMCAQINQQKHKQAKKIILIKKQPQGEKDRAYNFLIN